MTTIRPEAGAARAQGARAARGAVPTSICPYPAGGWLALNWLIGHALELGHRGAADVLREAAKHAWKREVRRREREAREATRVPTVKPEQPSKPCVAPGCTGRVVWRSGRSRASYDEASYCSRACRIATLNTSRPARRTCEQPGCENVLGRKQTRYCCWGHYRQAGGVAAHAAMGRAAKAAAPKPSVARPAPARAPAPPAVRPIEVTSEMWRAACEYMGEVEMRRFLRLDDEQVAKVLELQRRGAKVAA